MTGLGAELPGVCGVLHATDMEVDMPVILWLLGVPLSLVLVLVLAGAI
jgi:hypothetical protein